MENLDKLAGKLMEIAERLTGPQAQVLVEAARTEAYSELVSNAYGTFIGLFFAWVAWKTWPLAAAEWASMDDMDVAFWGLLAVVATVGAMLALLICIWGFINPWTWVAIRHPERLVAWRLLKLGESKS